MLLIAEAAAGAASASPGGESVGIFVAQLVVLLVVGRALGELLQRLGQPAVVGQLLAGVLLGPSVLGALWPQFEHQLFPVDPAQRGMLEGVAQLGVLMLLLITGMEMDFARVKGAKRAAVAASLCGIVVPFLCGLGLGEALPDALIPHPQRRLLTALFLGTALAISSVKIVASVIRDLNFTRRTVGQIIIAAAIIDDTIGWVVLSMIIGFAQHGEVGMLGLLRTAASTAAFLLVSFTLGRRVVYFLIRWTNDHLLSEMPVVTTVLVVMGVMALITQAFGVQTVLGAFVAGMLIGQSPILTRHIEEQLRGMIVAVFMPIFFGLAGLNADLRVLAHPNLLAVSLAFVVIASVGKFAGAFAGGALGGLTRAESLALGCGMNARGSTEVIVATIGLAIGALDTTLFTMIVTMAVVTTLGMPPMLRWAVRRIPLTENEQAQLERAAFEERGFVARVERVLLAADDSSSGRLASYLVGLLAAPRGIPVTAVTQASAATGNEAARRRQLVKDAMQQAAGHAQQEAPDGEAPRAVDLIARSSSSPAETVAAESGKGYDLLVIGVEPALAAQGGLSPAVARVAEGFERTVCVVEARGTAKRQPAQARRRMLLPVIGAAYSREAAELALALAQAAGAPLTALYVPTARERGPWRGLARSWRPDDAAEIMLQDVQDLSHHYSVRLRAAVGRRSVPEDSILEELRLEYSLMVLGMGARPGEGMLRGSVPAAVLARAPCSLLLVSSERP
jgi:Kef-type K+ transport system membrane component KefB/nucleotide-binding universal stress UspA family protein